MHRSQEKTLRCGTIVCMRGVSAFCQRINSAISVNVTSDRENPTNQLIKCYPSCFTCCDSTAAFKPATHQKMYEISRASADDENFHELDMSRLRSQIERKNYE